jgi:hypothetical protein
MNGGSAGPDSFGVSRAIVAPVSRQAVPSVAAYNQRFHSGADCRYPSWPLHRALKPANIMMASTRARLLDFGLAKQCFPRLHPARDSRA